MRRGLLHLARQPESTAEPVHEVARLNDVDVGVVRFEDELEAAPDLLFADRTVNKLQVNFFRNIF